MSQIEGDGREKSVPPRSMDVETRRYMPLNGLADPFSPSLRYMDGDCVVSGLEVEVIFSHRAGNALPDVVV